MAKKALMIGSTKATRAFDELKGRGFIICQYKGHFDVKADAGEGRASEWEITAEPVGDRSPKYSFRDWLKN